MKTPAAFLFISIAVLVSGCSLKSMAVDALADAIAESSDSYASDDDVAFVGLASPFGLKTTEGLLQEVPDHQGLLLSAARGFTQYAYVYIEQPANEIERNDLPRPTESTGKDIQERRPIALLDCRRVGVGNISRQG
jgi:hypothetical protein